MVRFDQYPGFYPPPMNSLGGNGVGRVFNSYDPGTSLAQVANQEQRYYDNVFRPLNRELVNDVDSTRLVDTAKENADRGFDKAQARKERMATRYGVAPTALDRSRADYDSQLARGINFDNTVNNARVDQYERNVGLRNQLVNVGRGISGQAMEGLSLASGLQTQRENNNNAIKAQNDAARRQTNASIASIALMAMMMM